MSLSCYDYGLMPQHPSMQQYRQWMQDALRLAHQALPADVPVGCVIVQKLDGQYRQVAVGHNTREQASDPTGHAEINAIRDAAMQLGRWRLDDCLLVVTLEPCPMCASAILQARLSVVVYGASDPLVGALGGRYALHQDGPYNTAVVSSVLEAECAHQLSAFFKYRRDQNPR